MASAICVTMSTESTPYVVEGACYSKDDIIAMHRKIQSLHDKDRSLEFSETELAFKLCYTEIQSQRDIERLRMKREVNDAPVEPVNSVLPYRFGDTYFSRSGVIDIYRQIQSAHSKDRSLEFTPYELQIKQWYREIQSQRDSERIAALKTDEPVIKRAPEPVTKQASESASEVYQIGEATFTDEEILAKYYAIQSLHSKDKSLEFTPEELQIKSWRREIQSRRDSERLRARKDATVETTASVETQHADLFQKIVHMEEYQRLQMQHLLAMQINARNELLRQYNVTI